MDDLSNHSVRGYEIRNLLGKGAFGAVYRATQPQINREVAVKIIRPNLADLDKFIQRFEIEAQLIARLEHLHIVPLYDYWHQDDGSYIVMRLMQGGSLRDSLEAGPWNPNDAAQLVTQISSALSAAHKQGVIHRDIKPANILLDTDHNAYLSDFGIAKDLGNEARVTTTGAIVGTPAYITPEQVQSLEISPQTDIYSLGVVLYELLTGHHPFPETSKGAMVAKHLHQPLPSIRLANPNLPRHFDNIIQRATAKAPAKRYPDVKSFSADVQLAQQEIVTSDSGHQNPVARSETPELEAPTGAVRSDSFFYVLRQEDEALKAQVLKAGTTTTIRAGRQTGKTSLLMRGIQVARNRRMQVIFLDFQRLRAEQHESLNGLLRYLAGEIAYQLDVDEEWVENIWKSGRPPSVKFDQFLSGQVLNRASLPILLAIDEADRLLDAPYKKDFFALLRSWDSLRAYDPVWENLNLVIVISTHPHILIDDANQSPFNVGLTIRLEDFSSEQVSDLNDRHGTPVSEPDLVRFIEAFGGHPYLIRQGLYVMVEEGLDINTGIPRHNNYTHIRIQTSDNVGWDLLKFCVVFTIFDNFLAINFTNPNIRPGFSCLS